MEILGTHNAARREEMTRTLAAFTLFPITPEAESLAERYTAAGIIPETVPEDALHVAIAVLNRQDVLASWNFRHLVNRRRRAAVNSLNLALSLPMIEILSPPEI